MHLNPNPRLGCSGEGVKKLSPDGGRKGGGGKNAHAACPRGPELKPWTYCVLGKGQ